MGQRGLRTAGPRWSARAGLALVAIAAFTLSGCTSQRVAGGPATSTGGKAKIGLVTKTDSNPYFVVLRDAAQQEATKQGAQLIALAGKFDGDNEGQVTAIENLVQQGVNTIMITPSNSTGVLNAIKQARDRGIMVIALDTQTDPPDAVDATYATDNTAAGRLQGAYDKAALAGKDPKILMVDGTPGSSVDVQRHGGFLQGMGLAPNDPHIAGSQPANGDQNEAQQAVENLLQRSPDANVIYTLNEPSARGAYAALKARGLTNSVILASIDGGCQAVQNIKDGQFRATAMQFPTKMAQMGVDAGVEFAKSGKKPSGFINTGTELVTGTPLPGVASKDVTWGQQNCWGPVTG
jgi:fructose transport system substrate-binding protein